MNLTRTDGARTTARTTSSAHRDRDDERDDLDPTAIARNVCEMWWPELDRLSQRLLNRMALIAEAPGARLQPDLIHHGKAGGGRPHATPWHQDGSLSMRDHWERRLARAADEDLATADQVPRRLQQAVLRAAYDLRSVTHRPEREAATPSPDDAGPERDEWICSEAYLDLPPHVVAALESARAGWVSAEAIRRTRRANGLRPDNGQLAAAPADARAAALALRYEGVSLREIARQLAVGKTTVARWVDEQPTPA